MSTSRENWRRIAQLHLAMASAWAAESRSPKRKDSISVYETAAYVAIVDEYRVLHSIERDAALEAGWPVWQEHQHFTYLADNGTLRDGEVFAFDRDAQTVTGRSWPFEDVCASLRTSEQEIGTVTIAQIVEGERLRNERHAERRRQYAIARGPQQADLFGASEATERRRA